MTKMKFFIVLFILLKNALACYGDIKSSGVTSPLGDIIVKDADNLSINCTLNDDYNGPGNASDIKWKFGDEELPKKYIAVLDNRTSRLYIANVTRANAGRYGCYLPSARANELNSICANEVSVGRPVDPVTDFKCISREWQNMTCTWPAPNYGVPTNWTLEILYLGVSRCPKDLLNDIGEVYGCFLSLATFPTYKLTIKQYHFRLTSKNHFGTTETNFTVDHYSKIVAAPPIKVQFQSIGINDMAVVWSTNPKFRKSPFNLVYQLQYSSQWERENLTVINIVSKNENNIYSLNMLKPWTEYTISIRCRVQNAPDESEMWSPSINITNRTNGMVPTAAVQMPISAYDDVNSNVDMDKRNITIFWKSLSPDKYNGPAFHYKISVFSNDKLLHQEIKYDQNFTATIPLLDQKKSYRFVVESANKFGTNTNVTEINVPSAVDKPLDVETFVVTHYINGTYELSWAPPNIPFIQDFTLFWCRSSHSRDDLCQETVNWININSTVTKYNVTVENPDSIYRFAISVNGRNSSSGMFWSKCIAYNRGGDVSKVKMISLTTEGPRSIGVMWSLDCKERLGTIMGFKIMYCIQKSLEDGCHGPQMNETVDGASSSTFILDNLKPFTNYSVRVAAITYTGILGEPGEVKIAQTAEGIPDGPPVNVTVIGVANTTVTLQWNPPEVPNGITGYYVVNYNGTRNGRHWTAVKVNSSSTSVVQVVVRNLCSYATIFFEVKACNEISKCSNYSDRIYVNTLIGVPGKPHRPVVLRSDEGYAFVELASPRIAGGPITEWRVLVRQYEYGLFNSSTEPVDYSVETFNTTSPIVNLKCPNKRMSYSFSAAAVNYADPGNNSEPLVGPYSDETIIDACVKDGISKALLGIIIAAGAIVGGCLLVFGFKKFCEVYKKNNNVTVDLPPLLRLGLPELLDSLHKNSFPDKPIKEEICSTIKPLYDRLQSVSSVEGRSSQSSTETTIDVTSITSVSDILPTLEEDSCGNCDLTTSSNYDFGHETDAVVSPDSVFDETSNCGNCHFEFPDSNSSTNVKQALSQLPRNEVPCYSKIILTPTTLENSISYMPSSKIVQPTAATPPNFPQEAYSRVGINGPPPGYIKAVEVTDQMKTNESDFQTGYSKVAQGSPSLKSAAVRPARGYVMVESIPINDINDNKLSVNTQNEIPLCNVYLEEQNNKQSVDPHRQNYVVIETPDKVISCSS